MTKAAKAPSEIDRLIELASAEKPSSATIEAAASRSDRSANRALSLEDKKDPNPSMWRVLLQLRVLLPYLSKLMPLIESGLLGAGFSRTAAQADQGRIEEGLAGIENTIREIAAESKLQASEIKYLHEKLNWISNFLKKEAEKQQEIALSFRSFRKVMTILAVVILALLVALTGAVLFLIVNRPG